MASNLYKEIIEVNKSVRLWGKNSPYFIFNDGLVLCPKRCEDNVFGSIKLLKSEEEFTEFIGDDIMAINAELLGKINSQTKKVSEIGSFMKFNNNKRLAVEVREKPEYIGVIDKPIESILEIRDKVMNRMMYFKENVSGRYQLNEKELDLLVNVGEELNFQVGDNVVILNKVLLPGINKKSDVIIETVDRGEKIFEVKVLVTRKNIDTYFFFKALKL